MLRRVSLPNVCTCQSTPSLCLVYAVPLLLVFEARFPTAIKSKNTFRRLEERKRVGILLSPRIVDRRYLETAQRERGSESRYMLDSSLFWVYKLQPVLVFSIKLVPKRELLKQRGRGKVKYH